MTDLVVRGKRVVLPGEMRPAAIHVRDGRILAVAAYDEASANITTIDARDSIIVPGLVDTHVHMNDPGRAEWEGAEHATRAAAAGGITTIVDMPLNSIPPTTTVAALNAKRDAIGGRCAVDVGFWGGVVPGNADDVVPLAREGVRGFKCFLVPSGVPEFQHVTEVDLRAVMPALRALDLPLLVHAEWPAALRDPDATLPCEYRTWLASRPSAAEQRAIELLISLSEEYRTRVHIVHLASADALPALQAARQRGAPITVETCPHYLTFAADDVPDGATRFKCAPPIRERDHGQRLWQALRDGTIDLVASDHSPAPPALKGIDTGDFLSGWGGIASLQVAFAAVWTGAAARGIPLSDVSRWMAAAPARLAGLSGQKGSIAVGCDADLVLWDPDSHFSVDAAALRHRHAVTPYNGMTLQGRVRTTLLRGKIIYQDGELLSQASGRMIPSAP